MAVEPGALTKDEEAAIASKFEEAAMALGSTPVLCNRFYLLQLGGHTALVFGSGFSVKDSNNDEQCIARASTAVAFDKSLAVELVLYLEKYLNITDEDRAAAVQRNSHLSSE